MLYHKVDATITISILVPDVLMQQIVTINPKGTAEVIAEDLIKDALTGEEFKIHEITFN